MVTKSLDMKLEKHPDSVRSLIQAASTQVHISFDGWTANNKIPTLGLAAFFLNRSFNVRQLLGNEFIGYLCLQSK
ncbi:uncharacterized protein BDR25DRAFT_351890 [Lindgomyces ingoldianus]|uniref:Uncharacterized protein n=1 Tax=Lindgomyces ingoldianus TaxID=673940 RepID=A0ACB6R515_9PLEO|nr:uncharacterized protein BDR25DRAFT_351890 [Lindgomyces ingoldianus]KAF2474339.1 hypothetical protein BDR25DRAFT_351890 [Lindgomyces ingoldianus]